MKRKGPTLCLLPILLIPFLLIAQEKNTKTKARILTRSSVIENPPPTKGPEQHAKFDPNARIVNVSAALFEVGTQDLNGVSQNDLKELVEFAIRNGAKDKMNLAVAVQAGKSAKVKGVTQIWSPNHFVPAKVHPSKDDKSSYSITKGKSSPNAVSYIIPTQAAQFAMTELGYQLEVTPEINADDSIKLSGQIVDKTLMGFETNSTPITMTKKGIAGSRRTHIGDDNRVTPKIRSQKRTFAVKQLKGAHYLPFRINQPNNFKLPTHPSATDQNKIDRFNQVLPPPSLREAPSRSGILVLKAETKAKQPAHDKSPEKPKREKKIYISSYLVETNTPWNQMSNTFTIGKQPDFFKTLPTTTILSDPLFQITLRMLNQQKGADLFSTPSIMLRPHERGKIETIREFIFPAEYEAGCLTPSDEIAFRPATPIKFDTVNTGVTTDLTANLAGDRHIHLKLKSTIIEFAGFINYGQPILEIRSQSVQRQKPFVTSANKILMPVLPTRQTETEVTIPDGSTVAFTMIRNERTQIAETTGPLGIKKTKNEITIPRYLTIFLKAQIVEPSGHPADPFLR